MKQLSMKDLIILAYKGVEAAERENNELKATLGAMYTNVLAQEKQQEFANVAPAQSPVNSEGAMNSEPQKEHTEEQKSSNEQKKNK